MLQTAWVAIRKGCTKCREEQT